ncbi:ORF6C domain-containing protein [Desulfurobacterium thermolithotrophum]|uniref:ORF6C domain-containing protein n=1 Tax=Desulfurobacterium thermolithotrophum TaxID=64160 RepID=UPI0013D5D232|nr:ORF6C domain-containing protein [Desulfurobacterium thermolithotrophum]
MSELKKKLEQLERLLEDEEVEKFLTMNISGGENFISLMGNVKKEIHNHFHQQKLKPEIVPELSSKQLKKIKDFIDRIVRLEIQAREFRVASPTGITAKGRKRVYAAVWKVFNDKYSIPSYKLLPAKLFDSAIKFLRNWESSLMNRLVKNGCPQLNVDRSYLLRRIYGTAKANGKTKEDLDLYSIQKFGVTLSEATTTQLWIIYRNYATKKRRKA